MTRIIAVDWSGALSGERSKIWLAEVREGRLVRLEDGRSRAEVVQYLIDEASWTSGIVVGLDFAFSFPEWFVSTLEDVSDVGELWGVVGKRGEEWLSACDPPFWGRPGKSRPEVPGHFRRTEELASEPAGSQPKSVFQVGGAGAVGTASIRGMPHLGALRSAGFSIWPFHEPSVPLVIEIYPRLLTGPVKKSSPKARDAYLRSGFPEIPARLESVAASSEDAFDAAVSAVVMARHVDELLALERTTDPVELIEGRIWWPKGEHRRAAAPVPPAAASCPFCAIDAGHAVAESSSGLAVRDAHPVSHGHTLVIPRAHVASLWDLEPADRADLWALADTVRAELARDFAPAGFNIGVNDGSAAGQTVEHAHLHVIPRYVGDVADPRGGVRWVVPERAAYWAK